jgi:hypothetical protein
VIYQKYHNLKKIDDFSTLKIVKVKGRVWICPAYSVCQLKVTEKECSLSVITIRPSAV